jgi:hypothetical protein
LGVHEEAEHHGREDLVEHSDHFMVDRKQWDRKGLGTDIENFQGIPPVTYFI